MSSCNYLSDTSLTGRLRALQASFIIPTRVGSLPSGHDPFFGGYTLVFPSAHAIGFYVTVLWPSGSQSFFLRFLSWLFYYFLWLGSCSSNFRFLFSSFFLNLVFDNLHCFTNRFNWNVCSLFAGIINPNSSGSPLPLFNHKNKKVITTVRSIIHVCGCSTKRRRIILVGESKWTKHSN